MITFLRSLAGRSRRGYVFLITVLFVGIIAFSIMGTYFILSTAALQNGWSLQQAAESLAYAESCAERALLRLQNDSGYTGQEFIAFDEPIEGSCEILVIGGSGNTNRTVCVEGIVGDSTRRLEILVERLLPSVQIFSWQEVALFTACAY